MTILIAGGCGHIGIHTAIQLMAQGHQVILADRLTKSFHETYCSLPQTNAVMPAVYDVDVYDADALEIIFQNCIRQAAPIEAVLHFPYDINALARGEDSSLTEKPEKEETITHYQNYLGGSLSLLRTMQKFHCRQMVFCSSAAVYKDNKTAFSDISHLAGNFSQNTPPFHVLEKILQVIHEEHKNWNITILRVFPVLLPPACQPDFPMQVEVPQPSSPTVPTTAKAFAATIEHCKESGFHVYDLACQPDKTREASRKANTSADVYPAEEFPINWLSSKADCCRQKQNDTDDICVSKLPSQLLFVRQQIDLIDSKLLTLFNKRAQFSLQAAKIKKDNISVYDPSREQQILLGLEQQNSGPLTSAHLSSIWKEVLSASRDLQAPVTAAYLGPEGTFSYFSGKEYLGNATFMDPCSDFYGIFQKVQQGDCKLGVVPLENSLHGTVGACFDLFYAADVHIVAEFYARISHCLLTRETNLQDIKTVYSHPQPLGQCGIWLRTHLPQACLISVESTAAAAYKAAQEPRSAAIGHHDLTKLTGLPILFQTIEDDASNWTRFVLIEKGSVPANAPSPSKAKTSILFITPDQPGALASILQGLANFGINMCKLESRPLRGERWKYVFFADLECDLRSQQEALQHLQKLCASLRILGIYPKNSTEY